MAAASPNLRGQFCCYWRDVLVPGVWALGLDFIRMRRAKTKIALVLGGIVIVAIIAGCVIRRTHTVSYGEFIREARPNLAATIISVSYYCGSKDGFDYFVVIPPAGIEERYRVAKSESKITERFPYTKDRGKWRGLQNWLIQRAIIDGPER